MGTNKPNAEQSAFAVNSLNTGLSKREYFTLECAKLLPRPEYSPSIEEHERNKTNWAKSAIRLADALIEALNK